MFVSYVLSTISTSWYLVDEDVRRSSFLKQTISASAAAGYNNDKGIIQPKRIEMKYLNNSAEFDALVGNETKLIVIDFTATW
jgi:hypothetical protein